MASFEIAQKATGKIEGRWVNNPNDKGKETYRGISRKSWPYWIGWMRIDRMKNDIKFPDTLELSKELQSEVIDFYKKQFWSSLCLDFVTSQVFANELFDTAVHFGLGTAGVILQRSLNVTNKNRTLYPNLMVDGKIGPKTVLMLNNHPDKKLLLKTFNILQGAKYIALCEVDETQEVFFSGWMIRVMEQWAINVVL